MQNVMKKAWEIAKEGQKNFGGKVKEYFAEALKIAWSIVKKAMDYTTQIKGIIDFTKAKPVELKGSEKQVKWAIDIRNRAGLALLDEVTTEEYTQVDLLPVKKERTIRMNVKNLVDKMVTKEGIKKHFDEMKGMPESRLVSEVESMNNLYDRFERFAEIITNDSAKFWIDNRDNEEKNYRFMAFKNYIRTGVKEF